MLLGKYLQFVTKVNHLTIKRALEKSIKDEYTTIENQQQNQTDPMKNEENIHKGRNTT